MSSEIILKHYQGLTKSYGYNVVPPHDDMIAISRFLRNDPNRVKDAIELLEMNAINYPSSAVTYETLGDTWMKLNDTKNATAAYQKALLIDAKNETVLQKIKNIGK